jgi:hypothetical protein
VQVLLGAVPELDIPLCFLSQGLELTLELPLLAPHLPLQPVQLLLELPLNMLYHRPAHQPRRLLGGEAVVEVHGLVGRVDVEVPAEVGLVGWGRSLLLAAHTREMVVEVVG